MNVLRERDAMNHRIANRRGSQNPPKAAGRSDGTRISINKLETRSERRQAFLEDFNMEHCRSTVSVALLAFSNGSDSVEPRKSFTQPVNSPSCVYLG